MENLNEIKEKSTLQVFLRIANICGNKYQLIVEINFLRKWVFMRFIGTHKAYDQIDVNKI